MILVTVGGQLPFDRLVHTVDEWAREKQREDVFAQIGNSSSPPQHIQWKYFLTPAEFQAKAREADVIIAHAGMGSILTALELQKPIVVMPRRAHLREHRNDHQWATVNQLDKGLGVAVAANEAELAALLDRLTEMKTPTQRRTEEYTRLLHFLSRAIDETR